ncbi:hypothetical protein ANN_08707 [Periplaneta americana]|uniref:SAP domain-containing protein n=1 Tax=Periplaneta americana TaxID=6978 RepID=A0ABQ8T279_PERAM|nr:hypothetical protein ANN_08707 [Periplaneta americana]
MKDYFVQIGWCWDLSKATLILELERAGISTDGRKRELQFRFSNTWRRWTRRLPGESWKWDEKPLIKNLSVNLVYSEDADREPIGAGLPRVGDLGQYGHVVEEFPELFVERLGCMRGRSWPLVNPMGIRQESKSSSATTMEIEVEEPKSQAELEAQWRDAIRKLRDASRKTAVRYNAVRQPHKFLMGDRIRCYLSERNHRGSACTEDMTSGHSSDTGRAAERILGTPGSTSDDWFVEPVWT